MLKLFLSISGRINFLQLARHSTTYVESTARLQFAQYVDFATINQEYILQKGSGHYIIAFDLSYRPKSGRATAGIGKYWSGAAQTTLWGLEAGLLSVIDVDNHTAFHLDAIQTPAKQEREAKGINLLEHYGQAILWAAPQLTSLSAYLAVDAPEPMTWNVRFIFAKKEFIDRILTGTPLQIISRLRKDANCYYLYQGPKKQGRGAPRKYAGKINWQEPDLTSFNLQYADAHLRLYDGVVYCKFLSRNIRIAFCQYLDENHQVSAHKIYFSTDLQLPALMIGKYYLLRFQQEFLIRDGKQFTGLQDCQARSTAKLEYHRNTALTAINIAKAEQWLNRPKAERGAFSMSSIKTFYHNHLLIDQLFNILPEDTKMIKNHPLIRQLYHFGAIAA
ncbi:hypothetical protein Q0590_28535 [Rhodocytophaga aerolata]|uniref:Transposase n=1 Tax=Rhodocytophaga aerolata TaxID=455078 RepID=A0ABT8RDT7_9BACT|nr:hypothetical protein [Rhodocytophaga aerolata]MDO1450262.1 hypothetical protein [Rhodocytophaga aerolata]